MAADNTIFTIDDVDEFIILTSKEPYQNVIEITGYTENIAITQGATLKREFRWTPETYAYSHWMDLTLDNLQTITTEGKCSLFFIEYKYTLETAGSVAIQSINLNVETYDSKTQDNWKPLPIAYPYEKGNRHYPLRIRLFTYNPYKQVQAIKLHKDLSYIVNSIHGIEIIYFRSIPQQRNRDVLLKEYTLSYVDDPMCLKVLVPNNDFPDNKFNYGMLGIDFEMPFEIHIDKRYFEWVFGHNHHPQKGDIVYFPLNDRIYEISSSQLVRDFMQDPIYWKMDLIKYQPKASRIEKKEVRDLIETVTTGVEELFGQEIKAQTQNITAPQHTIDKTSKFDPIREYINPNLLIQRYNLENSYTTISQFYYDLSTLYTDRGDYSTAVRYKLTSQLAETEDRSYSCWFREVDFHRIEKHISSVTRTGNTNEIVVNFQYGIPKVKPSQWLEIHDSNRPNWNIFGEITAADYDQSKLKVTMLVPEYILTKAYNESPNWRTSNGLIGKQYMRRNFLQGYDVQNQKGIMIDTFNSKWLRLIVNNQNYWIPLNVSLDFNSFYGLIVGFSNKFKQIGVFIYSLNSNKDTSLSLIFRDVINNVETQKNVTQTKYEVKCSNLQLTNIRLTTEIIEEEKHTLWLNQNIIRDSSLALIVDNAIPKMRLPYIGTAK